MRGSSEVGWSISYLVSLTVLCESGTRLAREGGKGYLFQLVVMTVFIPVRFCFETKTIQSNIVAGNRL